MDRTRDKKNAILVFYGQILHKNISYTNEF